jgi:hypothetical protein
VRDDRKGAHTPNCDRKYIGRQLDEQLDWFGLESASLHDAPRQSGDPRGKFVEVLIDSCAPGKIKVFG